MTTALDRVGIRLSELEREERERIERTKRNLRRVPHRPALDDEPFGLTEDRWAGFRQRWMGLVSELQAKLRAPADRMRLTIEEAKKRYEEEESLAKRELEQETTKLNEATAPFAQALLREIDKQVTVFHAIEKAVRAIVRHLPSEPPDAVLRTITDEVASRADAGQDWRQIVDEMGYGKAEVKS